MHNDYAMFMQSDYAKCRQTVVPLPFNADNNVSAPETSILLELALFNSYKPFIDNIVYVENIEKCLSTDPDSRLCICI